MQSKFWLFCIALAFLPLSTRAHEDLLTTAVAAPAPIEALYAAPHQALPALQSLPQFTYDFNAATPTGYAAQSPSLWNWDATAYAAHAYAPPPPVLQPPLPPPLPATYSAPFFSPPPAHATYAYAAAPVAPIPALSRYSRARVRAHPAGPAITKHFVRIGYAYPGGTGGGPIAAAPAPVAAPAPLVAAAYGAPADPLPFGIIG